MTTQYTPILKLALPVQGELSGTWGDVVNDNITSMIEQAIAGRSVVNTWTANSHVLTTANGTAAESRAAMLSLTDTGTALTGAGSVVCPALSKTYIVKNGTAQVITVNTASGSGIAVPVGKTMLVYCDGTNVLEGVDHVVTLSAGTLTITGLTTFASLKGADATTVTGILDEDNMASDSATKLVTQQSVKAYVDSQVGANNELSEVLANGNTTGGTDIAVSTGDDITFADSSKAIFGAGSDLQIYHDPSGPSSVISDQGAGDLVLRGSNQIRFQDATGAEHYAIFNENGAVQLYYDNAVKLSTTATGIDVTGTATMDGLTVDGTNAGLTITGPSSQLMKIATTSSLDKIAFAGGDGTVEAMRIDSNGDISFYEDTGTTPKFFWDASAESLGIGTDPSSYSNTIVADQGGNYTGLNDQAGLLIRASSGTTGDGQHHGAISFSKGTGQAAISGVQEGSDADVLGLAFWTHASSTGGDAATERMRIDSAGNVGIGTDSPSQALHVNRANNTATGIGLQNSERYYAVRSNNYSLVFSDETVGSERMRIDSSGNLLVGTTSTIPFLLTSGSGAGITPTGTFMAGAAAESGLFNRVGSDGNILGFYKSGTSVGSIGTGNSGNLYIGSGDTGINFNADINSVYPINAINGAASNGAIDLGYGGIAFKDLYLSGSVVAGNGATNAATLNAYSKTVSTNLPSALRVIENTTASSYWDIGSTGGASNNLNFYANANTTPKLTLTGAGNVGIGTSSPAAKLQITTATLGTPASTVAAGTNAGIYLEDGSTPTDNYFVSKVQNPGNDTPIGGIKFAVAPDGGNYSWAGIQALTSTSGNAGSLGFYTSASNVSGNNSTERMRIIANGNVGIGTSSPNAKLQVLDLIKVSSTDQSSGSIIFGDGSTANYNVGIGRWNGSTNAAGSGGLGYHAQGPINGGGHYWYLGDAAAGSKTEVMRINSSGSVGIGDSSPSVKLDVYQSTAGIGAVDFRHVNGNRILINPSYNYHDAYNHIFRGLNGTDTHMTIDNVGNVGIGVTPTSVAGYTTLNVGAGYIGSIIKIDGANAGHYHRILNNNGQLFIQADQGNTTGSSAIVFGVDATERARIDSSGNVLVGSSSTPSGSTDGTVIFASGTIASYRTGAAPAVFSRNASNGGDVVVIQQQGTTVGSIGANTGGLYIADAGVGFRFDSGGTDDIIPCNATGGAADASINLGSSGAQFKDLYLSGTANIAGGKISSYAADTNAPYFADAGNVGIRFSQAGVDDVVPCSSAGADRDNGINFGSAGARWGTVFAATGTINTSDQNEKQDIAELSEAEQRVAVSAKGLLRKFRWKDSVAEKGDDARIHFGVMAQDLQAAFAAEGLDASDYAMWCSDTWVDKETNEEKTRLGIRYSELLAFIIAAL